MEEADLRRHAKSWRIAGLVGVVSALVLAVAAVPVSATLVCPPGVQPPSKYCMNVPPIATTLPATSIGRFGATLNGISGPNVRGGDVTTFFFRWGRTATPHANRTPNGTVGSCPPGTDNPTYCRVPATKHVSARLQGLQPCTTYHYQLVSTNPDGTTRGSDMSFTTAHADPIAAVKVTPQTVRHGRLITITTTTRSTASLTIQLRRRGAVIRQQNPGLRRAGTFSRTMKMPSQTGRYTLRVIAQSNCGKQTEDTRVVVT
jgi:hypothetical protein